MAYEIETIELLGAYISGDVGPQERRAVEALLARDSDMRALADELRETLVELKHGELPVKDALVRLLRERIQRQIAERTEVLEFGVLAAASLSNDLDNRETQILQKHLSRNPRTRREIESLRAFSDTLKRGDLPVSEDLSRKLRERLQQAGKLIPIPVLAPSAQVAAPQKLSDSMRVFAAPRPVWPRLVVGAAATAAAAVLAFGIWRLASSGNSGGGDKPIVVDNAGKVPETTVPPSNETPRVPDKIVENQTSPRAVPGARPNIPEHVSPLIVEKTTVPNAPPSNAVVNNATGIPPTNATREQPKLVQAPESQQITDVVKTPQSPPGPKKSAAPEVAENSSPSPVQNPGIAQPSRDYSPSHNNIQGGISNAGGNVLPPTPPVTGATAAVDNEEVPSPARSATAMRTKDGIVLVQAPGQNQFKSLAPNDVVVSGSDIRTDISKASLSLPDGGKLFINSGTSLKLSFSGARTTILLSSGEIYFQGGGTLDLNAGQVKLNKATFADARIDERKMVRFSELDAAASVSAKNTTLRDEGRVMAPFDGSDAPRKDTTPEPLAAQHWRLGLDVQVTNETATPAAPNTGTKKQRTQQAIRRR